jgi:hypothetical protein
MVLLEIKFNCLRNITYFTRPFVSNASMVFKVTWAGYPQITCFLTLFTLVVKENNNYL